MVSPLSEESTEGDDIFLSLSGISSFLYQRYFFLEISNDIQPKGRWISRSKQKPNPCVTIHQKEDGQCPETLPPQPLLLWGSTPDNTCTPGALHTLPGDHRAALWAVWLLYLTRHLRGSPMLVCVVVTRMLLLKKC